AYHQGSRCHLIAPVATAFHPHVATQRFPGLTPLLQPVSHTSLQEQHRDIVGLSKSSYIDIENKHDLSVLLFPSFFAPPRTWVCLHSEDHIVAHYEGIKFFNDLHDLTESKNIYLNQYWSKHILCGHS